MNVIELEIYIIIYLIYTVYQYHGGGTTGAVQYEYIYIASYLPKKSLDSIIIIVQIVDNPYTFHTAMHQPIKHEQI